MSHFDGRHEAAEKCSMRSRVFNRLREDILSGRYPEHEELREMTVGEELGVSRTPVREAFRQLELEGLIQIVPNKGAYVTGITEKDVKDIYMIRSLLEGLCARWATEHITKEQMHEMEENVFRAQFYAKSGFMEELAVLDNQFHEIMYEACESKLLEHQLRAFHQYVLRVRKKTLAKAARGIQSNNEHRAIMEAIKAGDGNLAEELAHQHMINAYDNMVENGLHEIYAAEADGAEAAAEEAAAEAGAEAAAEEAAAETGAKAATEEAAAETGAETAAEEATAETVREARTEVKQEEEDGED